MMNDSVTVWWPIFVPFATWRPICMQLACWWHRTALGVVAAPPQTEWQWARGSALFNRMMAAAGRGARVRLALSFQLRCGMRGGTRGSEWSGACTFTEPGRWRLSGVAPHLQLRDRTSVSPSHGCGSGNNAGNEKKEAGVGQEGLKLADLLGEVWREQPIRKVKAPLNCKHLITHLKGHVNTMSD